jgi:plasmid stabilization system protein ParE
MKDHDLLLGAEIDLQHAFERYENLSEGRGVEFLMHFDHALNHICNFPQSAPKFHKEFRRILIQKFPYGIYYTDYPTRILIAAVLDLRQDPARIAERLDEM